MSTVQRQQHVRGMTLVELLVAMAVTLTILPALYLGIDSLYDTHGRTFTRALAISSATGALKDIVQDVRGAVYSESGALPLVTIGTSTLVLYADTDLDGRIERVRYTLTGTTVEKGVIEPTATSSYPSGSEVVETHARSITNNASGTPLFRYFTATSTEITTQSRILDVRRITVTMEPEARRGRDVGTATLQSSASIRNLKNTY